MQCNFASTCWLVKLFLGWNSRGVLSIIWCGPAPDILLLITCHEHSPLQSYKRSLQVAQLPQFICDFRVVRTSLLNLIVLLFREMPQNCANFARIFGIFLAWQLLMHVCLAMPAMDDDNYYNKEVRKTVVVPFSDLIISIYTKNSLCTNLHLGWWLQLPTHSLKIPVKQPTTFRRIF